MKINRYTYRLNSLVTNGIKVGATSAFLSSLAYTILFVVFTFIVQLLPPTNPGFSNPNASQIFASSIAIGGFMCMVGIVPATIIGVIGGLLIGLILIFWGKGAPSIFASFIGLLVGTTLILTVNYFLWSDIYPPGNTSGPITFLEFFSLSQNPIYFIPSIIAIPISAYVGRKINKTQILETANQQTDIQASEEN